MSSSSIPQKLWLAVRFVLFGVGGFWLLMFSFLSFVERVSEHSRSFLNPLVSFPLTIIGAVMMLFGTGEWGRWAYLWLFLSGPLLMSAALLLAPFYWAGKEFGILLFAIPTVGSYVIVRRYFRRP
jgi:hypothetical protein